MLGVGNMRVVRTSSVGLVVALAASMACAQNESSGWGVYALAKAEAWSNGVPVLGLDGDWSRGYDAHAGPQRAYAFARAELGALVPSIWSGFASSWRIGALTRVEASGTLSGDAAEVLYRYQSQIDPDQPGSYNADSSILFWKGQGLTVHAPTVRLGAFSLDTSWDHLKLSRMRVVQTQGVATYNADGSYGYQMQARDDSWKTTEQFMRPPQSQGVGDAMSLSLRWQGDAPGQDKAEGGSFLPSWVALNVDDVWSLLQWQGINGNDAVLNSNVATRSPDGYIEYQAAINGQYTRRTLRERIPVGTQVQFGWRRPEGTWALRVNNRLGLWQRWVSWQSEGTVHWQLAAEPVHRAVQLGVAWRGMGASVMADRLDNGAHVQGGQLSWLLGF
jgi:hypothetical protein